MATNKITMTFEVDKSIDVPSEVQATARALAIEGLQMLQNKIELRMSEILKEGSSTSSQYRACEFQRNLIDAMLSDS